MAMKRSANFKFKQFEVHQLQSAMKVGTDGVILGAWASAREQDRSILDIGTGTGLLALMMAQRTAHLNPPPMIDAVEIETLAAAEALFNITNSPWSDRICVHECSFQQLAYQMAQKGQKFDLIISNPPYFVDSSLSTQAARTAARHAALLPYDDLISGVNSILDRERGRFVAIFPSQEGGIFIAKAAASGLFCNRRLNVRHLQERPIKRMVCQFSHHPTPEIEESELIISHGLDQQYTTQYMELTKDFYLRF